MNNYSTSLFIFRRGLRVRDNTGLISTLKKSDKVIPAFIFTPEQIENNEYRSNPAVQFMIESLKDLENQLENKDGKLYKFFGKPHDIVEKISDEIGLDAVFLNRDYTPYSKKRDQKIKDICEDNNVDFKQKNDYLLLEPEEIKTNKDTPYQVFTPFFNKAKDRKIDKPQDNNYTNYYIDNISFARPNIYQEILQERNDNLFKTGGRSEAEKIIRNLHNYENYETEREIPSQDGTTGLSAHNKFGTVSIREVYWNIRKQLSKDHNLIQELFWRDFYTHIAFHKPEVFGEAFKDKYQDLEWEYDEEKFDRWCEGKTGFPIVDAGMRQLNNIGWMHNRVRMIVASFLTKDLQLDWRWGEKYFAKKLIDYDPAVNNGSWQWAASTGCDAQPYFRIFNPWTQQEDYDPEAKYIKEYVPELKDLDPSAIHNWQDKQTDQVDYPEPIVDHSKQRERALARYKKVND